MARKTLLTEAEIRQFMKLANIKPLQEMGGELPVPGMRDDEEDEPGMRDMREADRDDKDDEDEPGMRDMMEEELYEAALRGLDIEVVDDKAEQHEALMNEAKARIYERVIKRLLKESKK